jgi:cytochrome c-type biogenesis protein CcmE
MLTKKVKKRFYFLIIFILLSIFSVFFILNSLKNNILYFKSPTDIKSGQDIVFNENIRVGGMVKKNSLVINNSEIKFTITDFKNEILVSYRGTVPNLFSEGKGVVAEGKLNDKKFFVAERILAKHDENYMPPELKSIMNQNAK